MLLQVSLNQNSDKWFWLDSEDGEQEVFSVKSVRSLLDKSRITTDNYVPERCKWIPTKCNLFIWRADMYRIATVDALIKRNIDVGSPICRLCGDGDENVEHLFTSCFFASMLWSWIGNWCKCRPLVVFFFRDLIEVHNHAGLDEKKKKVLKGLIRIRCWSIWRSRNEARFKNKEAKLEFIIGEVKKLGFLWYKTRNKNVDTSWSDWCKFVDV
ncbi:putative reverse transcriptase zinc-binding domain-containing protein [Helianthus debilis subsp. tardiflorus]